LVDTLSQPIRVSPGLVTNSKIYKSYAHYYFSPDTGQIKDTYKMVDFEQA
jgi:hypothetical protein